MRTVCLSIVAASVLARTANAQTTTDSDPVSDERNWSLGAIVAAPPLRVFQPTLGGLAAVGGLGVSGISLAGVIHGPSGHEPS